MTLAAHAEEEAADGEVEAEPEAVAGSPIGGRRKPMDRAGWERMGRVDDMDLADRPRVCRTTR